MTQSQYVNGLKFNNGEEIFIDDNDNLSFRYLDDKNIEQKITLKDLYSKLNAVQINELGELLLVDTTNENTYLFSDVLDITKNWQKHISGGSLWWSGSKQVNHVECANIPASEFCDASQKVMWSVDKNLEELRKANENINIGDNYNKLTNNDDDCTLSKNWDWYDVSNMQMIVPPINDANKIAMINTTLSFTSRRDNQPIVFRIYDATNQEELSRVSVMNSNDNYANNPITLQYLDYLSKNKVCKTNEEECGVCNDLECVDGDPYVFDPNKNYVSETLDSSYRLIKIQYHVDNLKQDFFDRIFGYWSDGNIGAISSINIMMFDSNSGVRDKNQQGTALFVKQDSYQITFENELSSNNYTISLSPNKNVNTWFESKKSTGFKIKSEFDLNGNVDWQINIGE